MSFLTLLWPHSSSPSLLSCDKVSAVFFFMSALSSKMQRTATDIAEHVMTTEGIERLTWDMLRDKVETTLDRELDASEVANVRAVAEFRTLAYLCEQNNISLPVNDCILPSDIPEVAEGYCGRILDAHTSAETKSKFLAALATLQLVANSPETNRVVAALYQVIDAGPAELQYKASLILRSLQGMAGTSTTEQV